MNIGRLKRLGSLVLHPQSTSGQIFIMSTSAIIGAVIMLIINNYWGTRASRSIEFDKAFRQEEQKFYEQFVKAVNNRYNQIKFLELKVKSIEFDNLEENKEELKTLFSNYHSSAVMPWNEIMLDVDIGLTLYYTTDKKEIIDSLGTVQPPPTQNTLHRRFIDSHSHLRGFLCATQIKSDSCAEFTDGQEINLRFADSLRKKLTLEVESLRSLKSNILSLMQKKHVNFMKNGLSV